MPSISRLSGPTNNDGKPLSNPGPETEAPPSTVDDDQPAPGPESTVDSEPVDDRQELPFVLDGLRPHLPAAGE